MPSRPAVSASDSDIFNARQEPWGRSLLKRALLGLVLLFILVSSGAWLMHNGIEAEAEPAAGEQAISAPADRTS